MKTIKIEIKNKKNRKSKISYLTVQIVKGDINMIKGQREKESLLINEDYIRTFFSKKFLIF